MTGSSPRVVNNVFDKVDLSLIRRMGMSVLNEAKKISIFTLIHQGEEFYKSCLDLSIHDTSKLWEFLMSDDLHSTPGLSHKKN